MNENANHVKLDLQKASNKTVVGDDQMVDMKKMLKTPHSLHKIFS